MDVSKELPGSIDPALANTLGARIFRATVSGAAVKGFKASGLSNSTF